MGTPRAPRCPEMEVLLGGWVGVRTEGGGSGFVRQCLGAQS